MWGTEIGDVTGDGRDDLIVAEHLAAADVLQVYAQLPNGSLAATPTSHPLDAAPVGAAWQDWLDTSIGDLDDDGIPDVVVGRFDGLEIFHGTGPSFDDPVVLGAQGVVEVVAAVDLNGDGMDDLVYGDDQGGHRIMRRLQTTPGVFGSAVQIASTTSGRFSVGDVNTDGRPDILVEDPWAVELQILMHNPADQGFTSTTEPVDRARSAAVGDINGDGPTTSSRWEARCSNSMARRAAISRARPSSRWICTCRPPSRSPT